MNLIQTAALYAEVNFLPGWYVQVERRRRSHQRQYILIAVMVIAMMGLAVNGFSNRAELKLYHASLLEQVKTTKHQITEVGKLHVAQAELSRQLKVQRDLHQPINYSQICGTLAHLTPQSISLRDLQVRTDRLTTTRPMTEAERAEYIKNNPAAKSRSAQLTIKQSHYVVKIEVAGIAPSDVDVANFIGAVAGSSLFQQVKMLYSRQGMLNNLVTREFRLQMQVPLNVTYQLTPIPEVADAH